MEVKLQNSGLSLEPNGWDDSCELNEWFNALGRELHGPDGYFGTSLKASVRIMKRDGRDGVWLSLDFESK